MWRLQNDTSPLASQAPAKKEEPDDQPSFTEITIDVRPEEHSTMSGSLRRF
jgi:twitching motility protein PilU